MFLEMPQWQKENAQHVIDRALEIFSATRGDSDSPQVHTEVVYSKAVSTLIDASKGAWMIVVGSQGLGALGRLLLGSVSTALVHHAHCPVAVIHSDQSVSPDLNAAVLLGIDGSTEAHSATALAFDDASRRGVELVALHAWSTWRYTRPSDGLARARKPGTGGTR